MMKVCELRVVEEGFGRGERFDSVGKSFCSGSRESNKRKQIKQSQIIQML